MDTFGIILILTYITRIRYSRLSRKPDHESDRRGGIVWGCLREGHDFREYARVSVSPVDYSYESDTLSSKVHYDVHLLSNISRRIIIDI